MLIKNGELQNLKKEVKIQGQRTEDAALSSTTFLLPSAPMGPSPVVYKAVYQSCRAHSQVELNKPFPLP